MAGHHAPRQRRMCVSGGAGAASFLMIVLHALLLSLPCFSRPCVACKAWPGPSPLLPLPSPLLPRFRAERGGASPMAASCEVCVEAVVGGVSSALSSFGRVRAALVFSCGVAWLPSSSPPLPSPPLPRFRVRRGGPSLVAASCWVGDESVGGGFLSA